MAAVSPRAWRTAFAVLLSCGVVGAAAWLVFFSPVLGVREIAISGNVAIPDDQIRQAAAVPGGRPLAVVDLDLVRRSVAALRRVESARVERRWPATLVVRVVERRPVVAVLAGGRASVLDRYGVVIETRGAAPVGLPVLERGRAGDGDLATKAALTVVVGLPRDLLRRVQTVRAVSASDVALVLADGRTIRWGGPERTRDKARVVLTLLERPGDSYDVSSPDVVTVK